MGAGILPPLSENNAEDFPLTFITGALPKRPPNSTISPISHPGAGIILTAVVLLLITPIAASSAPLLPEVRYVR